VEFHHATDIRDEPPELPVVVEVAVQRFERSEELHDMRRVRHGDGAVCVEDQAEKVGSRPLGAYDEDGVDGGVLALTGE
jgi:hypothetical protein